MKAHTQLPKVLRYPGGYSVKVRIGARGPGLLDENSEAEYDTDTRTITLWEGLTPLQRWRTLTHEMLHALADYQVWVGKELIE